MEQFGDALYVDIHENEFAVHRSLPRSTIETQPFLRKVVVPYLVGNLPADLCATLSLSAKVILTSKMN